MVSTESGAGLARMSSQGSTAGRKYQQIFYSKRNYYGRVRRKLREDEGDRSLIVLDGDLQDPLA